MAVVGQVQSSVENAAMRRGATGTQYCIQRFFNIVGKVVKFYYVSILIRIILFSYLSLERTH